MQLITNTFHTPYFIFIKESFKMTDQELLQKLDLQNYELVTDEEERQRGMTNKRYLFLTEDACWTHLMDNWHYTLWHNKELRTRIKILSADFDVFYCSVGDCDESFDFAYFQKGRVVREYVVEDPNFRGGEVVKDFGKPFPNEKAIRNEPNPFKQIVLMAKLVGIDIEHRLEDIRCYGRWEDKSEMFIFEEN